MASKDQIDALKAKAQELLDAVSALPVDDAAPAPAPADPSAPAPAVDPAALQVLQDKIDALAKDNAKLRELIKTEIEDEKADTARLEAGLAPVAEPAPVPVVDVETVASVPKAEEKVASPDAAATPVAVQ